MSQLIRIPALHLTRRLSLALFAVLAASLSTTAVAQSGDRGTWRIYADRLRDRVQLSFEEYEGGGRRHGQTSYGVRPSELSGLSQSQLSSYNGPVKFQLVRDVGTFNFEGEMRSGQGTGFYTFSPDSRFSQQLASRGYERPTA
ncbi:MAG: hypothetical protein ACJ79X_01020, partial [Gemmatimonadaceae bacterium]